MKKVFGFYYFMLFIAMASSQPFLSLYLSGKGVNGMQIGLILAAASGAGILAQPILGHLNDNASDPRRIIFLSALLSPLTFSGFYFFHGFWFLFLVSILFAIAQSTTPILDALTVQEGHRSRFNYGQIRLWGALSFALTTIAAGFVYHRYGLQIAFFIYGCVGFILAITSCFLPRTSEANVLKENVFIGIWNVIRDLRLVIFVLICFVMSICSAINFGFLSLYYQSLHYPMAFVGANFTVAALIEVPFFYLSGFMMRRFGKLPMVIVASLLYGIKYAIMAVAPGPATVISIQLLDGIAYALYWSASVQLVSDLAPHGRTATSQTLYGAVASSLSNIAGSALGGFLYDHDGPLVMYAYTAGIAGLACLSFIAFAFATRRRFHTASS